MEEAKSPLNSPAKSWISAAYDICSQIAIQATKLHGQSRSKNFFVSIAHEFLEKLIHLHCPDIKKILAIKTKQLERAATSRSTQASADFKAFIQEYKKLSGIKFDRESLLDFVKILFTHLVYFQCKGKSIIDIQNIFLEINCSLNYACPLCIKKINSDQPQSFKLIKNHSQEPEPLVYPCTMKTISLKEPDQLQRLPNIQKPSKFESILDSMKAERSAIKKLEEKKEQKINKIWNMLGNLINLDRDKFIIDHIFNQNQGKENKLLKELVSRNVKNQECISNFCNRKRKRLIDSIQSKTYEDKQQALQETKCQIQRKKLRSISPRLAHRKLSAKKHVKILEPISNNTTSVYLCSKAILEETNFEFPPDMKTINAISIGQNIAWITNSKHTKANYSKRPFKPFKDMLATVDGSEFADYSERPVVNKSLKLI